MDFENEYRNVVDLLMKSTKIDEPTALKLPDIARWQINNVLEKHLDLMGNDLQIFTELAQNPSLTTDSVLDTLANKINYPNRVTEIFRRNDPVGAGIFCRRLLHIANKGALFTIRDELNFDLEQSDCGDEITPELIELPFQNIYIKFGTTLSSNLRLSEPTTGLHILEGCYLRKAKNVTAIYGSTCPEEKYSKAIGIVQGDKIDILDMAFMGSPKESLFDDTFKTNTLYFTKDNKVLPLTKVINDQGKIGRQIYANNSQESEFQKQVIKEVVGAMNHASKCILYLNSKDIRQVFQQPRKDLLEKLSKAGPSKEGKIKRQLQRTYDTILIGPDDSADLDTKRNINSSIKSAHIRRGHWHTVLYGPGKSKKYLKFFKPTVVKKSEDDDPTPKDYDAK